MDPPAYINTVSFNKDTEELEVKTAIDREECPYLVVGIQVVIVLYFSVKILSLIVMFKGSWDQGFILPIEM